MKIAAIFLCAILFTACQRMSERGSPVSPGGDSGQGRQAMEQYGCAGCHVIPGLEHRSNVAPPLTQFALRNYVGGTTPNSLENVARWIMNPQALNPKTAMPNLNVPEAAARDMANYLYTLK